MKPDQMYQHLKELTEKLDVRVSEQNLKKTGPRIQSGFCKLKERKLFIIDKHLPLDEKNNILAEFIAGISGEEIYIVPAVREFIQKNKGSHPGRMHTAPTGQNAETPEG